MNKLKAGFARVNITPMLGIEMAGYFRKRFAEGVRDELELSVLAVSAEGTTALLISADACFYKRELMKDFQKSITEATGVPSDCIYIHTTHIHTGGPDIEKGTQNPLEIQYLDILTRRMVEASKEAIEDMKPAKMGWAVGKAPNVAFIRRFHMKDGTVATNPGINHPDIVSPVSEIDDRVNILRFDREEGETLVLVNFGNHPDVVGYSKFSADWPGFMRRTVEAALPECKCIFFNGCQGDVNHWNVHPKETDRLIYYRSVYDYPEEHYQFARYIGRAMAGTVLQEYDKTKYTEVDTICCMQKTMHIPTNMPKPEELPEAHRLCDLADRGETEELSKQYPGMAYGIVIGEARRMVALENGPEYYEMDLSAVALGKVALIGLPGEPFTGIGVGLKEAEGWELILPTCLTNGSHGYFPMKDAFEAGGYEGRTSYLKGGAAELMIEEGKTVLAQLLDKIAKEKK